MTTQGSAGGNSSEEFRHASLNTNPQSYKDGNNNYVKGPRGSKPQYKPPRFAPNQYHSRKPYSNHGSSQHYRTGGAVQANPVEKVRISKFETAVELRSSAQTNCSPLNYGQRNNESFDFRAGCYEVLQITLVAQDAPASRVSSPEPYRI
eukprot:9126637-Pyramimonas_sp.AAC.2